MMNVKSRYKKNQCNGIHDSLDDSFISLVSFEDFSENINKYIENVSSKRDGKSESEIVKRL